MESDVSRLLGPMMKDGWTTGLPPRFQAKLAAWAVKTAFVADYLQVGHRVVSDAQYGDFYAVKLPLPGQLVWVAYRSTLADLSGRDLMGSIVKEPMTKKSLFDGNDPVSAQADFDRWTAEGKRGYWFTIACGHFVCQVMGHNFPLKVVIDVDASGPNSVLQNIWPIGGSLTWPPLAPIESVGGLEGLHGALHGPPPDAGANH